MKKTLLILIILLFCIGCNNTKKRISEEEAYTLINNMFHYEEEYNMEYYKQVKYKDYNKNDYYYAFLITSEKSDYSYYVLIDVYGQNVISPVLAEEIE